MTVGALSRPLTPPDVMAKRTSLSMIKKLSSNVLGVFLWSIIFSCRLHMCVRFLPTALSLFPPRASFAAYSPGEHRAGISKSLFASSLSLCRWASSLSSAGAMFDADVSVAGVAALSVGGQSYGLCGGGNRPAAAVRTEAIA
jgi:hypothetical protein